MMRLVRKGTLTTFGIMGALTACALFCHSIKGDRRAFGRAYFSGDRRSPK